jgi:hypothetical protein
MKATCHVRMVDERNDLIIRSAFEVAILFIISSDARQSRGERLTASPRSTLSNALCLIGGGVILVAPYDEAWRSAVNELLATFVSFRTLSWLSATTICARMIPA